MKTVSTILILAGLGLSGCAHKGVLNHIPKDVKLAGLEVVTSSPWGGTISVKAESYEGTNYQSPTPQVEKADPKADLLATIIKDRVFDYLGKLPQTLSSERLTAIHATLSQATTLEELDKLIAEVEELTK